MTTADIFYLTLVLAVTATFALTLGYYSLAVKAHPDEPRKQ